LTELTFVFQHGRRDEGKRVTEISQWGQKTKVGVGNLVPGHKGEKKRIREWVFYTGGGQLVAKFKGPGVSDGGRVVANKEGGKGMKQRRGRIG